MARQLRSELPDGVFHVTTRGVDRCAIYRDVVETTVEQLWRGLHRLNGVHALRFNKRHRRTGHLFGDRYASWVIGGDDYLAAACEYVVNNPVRAGLCALPEEWRWSGSASGFPTAKANECSSDRPPIHW